jgi:hypothetical protein
VFDLKQESKLHYGFSAGKIPTFCGSGSTTPVGIEEYYVTLFHAALGLLAQANCDLTQHKED